MSSKIQASKKKLNNSPQSLAWRQHLCRKNKKAVDLRTVIHWKIGQVNFRAAS